MSKLNWKSITIGIFLLIIVTVGYIYWQNNTIVVSKYEYKNQQVPSQFTGFTIMQLSDLHNHDFGDNGRQLITKVRENQPDIIVFTGDLIDAYRTKMDVAFTIVDQLRDIAPMYYVVGNHEARITNYPEFESGLRARGVHVLRNELAWITEAGAKFALVGLDDPDFFETWRTDEKKTMKEVLTSLQLQAEDALQILLAHRPEYLDFYAEQQVPLVLSGHAHGGQIRVPFTEGLFAPGQGLFPTLTSGVHQQGETSLIISRGLGNSAFPIRVQNQPEIVIVTLASE